MKLCYFVLHLKHLGVEFLTEIVLQGQMKLERTQILSLFMKVMKKFYKYLHAVASNEIQSTLPRLKEVSSNKHGFPMPH